MMARLEVAAGAAVAAGGKRTMNARRLGTAVQGGSSQAQLPLLLLLLPRGVGAVGGRAAPCTGRCGSHRACGCH